jgi:hypothetical protein
MFAGAPVSYLKMALAATAEPAAKEAWQRIVRDRIEHALGSVTDEHFRALTIYYLAQVISAARQFILSQKRDFGEQPDDICFVNMGVPIAQAESRRLGEVFLTALQYAWHFAFGGGLRPCGVTRLLEIVRTARIPVNNGEFCYLYPEVSANVQSYIRSPAAQEKLHLFVDVGAGTVDLSAFIWNPATKHDRPLTYLAADVLPLGASQIELRAAASCHIPLDEIRACKEDAGFGMKDKSLVDRRLREARESIKIDLRRQADRILHKTRSLILTARHDRRRESQFFQMQLLMGGGGSHEPLYGLGVRAALSAVGVVNPPTLPLPIPSDLVWPHGMNSLGIAAAYRRLTVAYGLSFLRADLHDHWLPKEIDPIRDIDEPTPPRHLAPSKDEC